MRIAGLSAQYPNLIMVPEPMSEFRFTVFTRDPALAPSEWDSLRPLRVGNKGDGLLRREGSLQRTVVGGQPEGELGALRSVPPVTGE